jgi:ubiquinone/menaquinone biosynthesis C-methylase UbiE
MTSAFRKLIASPVRFCVFFYSVVWILLILAHYPYDWDPVELPKSISNQSGIAFYGAAYADDTTVSDGEEDDIYVKTAKRAAEIFDVNGAIERFVSKYGLKNRKILEVGAGRGSLQDIVNDYTGLDISPTARRYYHKPFVQASATDIPFNDSTFDAVWTIWVLEHVPNPERALVEMRRVLKPDGLLYLDPAWSCTPWAADGYAVRPYTDFGIRGKLEKASLPIRTSPLFQMMYRYPIRAARRIGTSFSPHPTKLRYNRLAPNYDKYWGPDSDAVNSLDRHETLLWFESRGDQCLNCGTATDKFTYFYGPMIIRVRKSDTTDRHSTAAGAKSVIND